MGGAHQRTSLKTIIEIRGPFEWLEKRQKTCQRLAASPVSGLEYCKGIPSRQRHCRACNIQDLTLTLFKT
jgi:hypothetical protein